MRDGSVFTRHGSVTWIAGVVTDPLPTFVTASESTEDTRPCEASVEPCPGNSQLCTQIYYNIGQLPQVMAFYYISKPWLSWAPLLQCCTDTHRTIEP